MAPSVRVSDAASTDPAAAPYTVVLYYKYVRIAETHTALTQFVAAHESLCRGLQLNGRVRIAREGINGTLGGSASGVEQYIASMESDERFVGIDWKTSASLVEPFPELLVRLAPEIVALELPDAACDPAHGGTHLTPQQFHDSQRSTSPENIALIDVRNNYEYNIGHFEGALNPNTRRFSQFPEWVQHQLPMLQAKEKILMYCTGGIRCEKASAYLKHLGLANVYQLQGGIHRYLEHFPDGGGQFHGKNFVFDQRIAMASTDETVAGKCGRCAEPYDIVSGLRCQYCRTHVMLCATCRTDDHDDDWVFCRDHAYFADGSLEQLLATIARLERELLAENGRGRKGKRRSIRKQLDTLEQARIRALSKP